MEKFRAAQMARRLMSEFKLHKWGWRFGWLQSNARTTLGRCLFDQRIIKLNPNYVEMNNETNVENTIRHEIAHAICGFQAGHGPEWRTMATKVGARPNKYTLKSEVKVRPANRQRKNWMAICPSCEAKIYRVRVKNKDGWYHKGCRGDLKWQRI